MPKNAILAAQRGSDEAAEGERALDPAGGADERERFLAAGLAVITRYGTSRSPRVADVVAEAHASIDAFYRHFPGKDELVAAIADAGTLALCASLERRMAGRPDAASRLRAWVEGVMARAQRPGTAETTRAVLWNAARVGDDTRRRGASRFPLAALLEPAVAGLGSPDPAGDALLVCYAVMTRMEEFLWRRAEPTPTDVERLVGFCLRAVTRTGDDAVHHPAASPLAAHPEETS